MSKTIKATEFLDEDQATTYELLLDAYLASPQADVVTDTWTPLKFDTEIIDVDSAYAPATGLWNAPRTEVIDVLAQGRITSLGADKSLFLHIEVDGVTVAEIQVSSPISSSRPISVTRKLSIVAGEVVGIEIRHSHGSNRSTGSGNANVFFQISR